MRKFAGMLKKVGGSVALVTAAVSAFVCGGAAFGADLSDQVLHSITLSSDFGFVPSGTSINTGISPDETLRLEMLVWVASPNEKWFGCWDTAYNDDAFGMANDFTGVYTAAGDSGSTTAFGSAATIPPGIHLLAVTNGVFYCDGAVVADRHGSFSVTGKLHMFAIYEVNAVNARSQVGGIWCKYVRIYTGDTLLRDYRAEVSDGNSLFREQLSGTVAIASTARKSMELLNSLQVPVNAYANTAAIPGLGIYPTANTVVETLLTNPTGVKIEAFGAWNYPQSTSGSYKMGNFGIAIDTATTTYVGWGVGTTSKSYANVPTAGEWIFHLGPDFGGYISSDYSVTNAVLSDYTGQTFDSALTQPLYLCAQNRGGSVHSSYQAVTLSSWKWFKIREAGTLVRYFVPARFGSSVGYFDVVRGGLYTSVGGTAFVAGAVKDDETVLTVAPQQISAQATAVNVSAKIIVPATATAKCYISANGRTLESGVSNLTHTATVGFELNGLAPSSDYVSTIVVDDGNGVVITNTAAFTTAAANSGRYLDGYQVLDAIRFDGTQYLSTGITPTDHRVMVEYETLEYVSDAHILGNITDTDHYKWLNWTEYTSSGTEVYYIGHHGDAGHDWGTRTPGRHVVVLNDKKGDVYTHTFDGEVIESGADKLASCQGSLCLNFRGASSTTSSTWQMKFKGKIYAFQMTDNSTGLLVADYLPVRNASNGNYAFYDLVSGTLKTATFGSLLGGSALGGTLSASDPVFSNGVFSVDVELSGSAGTLKCYYGAEYGGESVAGWTGSAEIAAVTSVGTSLTARVSLPTGTKYVRLAVDVGRGVDWFDAFATDWLPDGVTAPTIPDTAALLSAYVRRFNQGDNENLPCVPSLIDNAHAESFLLTNAPRFACPDKDIERTYYFRWWTYRKHIRQYGGYYTVSEFLKNQAWSGAGNTIVCPSGHHFREGRWLRDPKYLASLARFWLSCPDATHRRNYVSWLYTSVRDLVDITGDETLAAELLDDAIANYDAWAAGFTWNDHGSGNYEPMGGDGEGGFLSTCDREGSEYALTGNGYRPMINSAMWSEAATIAKMAKLLGKDDIAARYAAKADATLAALTNRCWSSSLGFFTVQNKDKSTRVDVRELHGYSPWYFGAPVTGCAADWAQLSDPNGFAAKYGLSFPERRADGFAIAQSGYACMWNGPSWPYATSIALTALANELHAGRAVGQADTYRQLLKQYAVQHRLTYVQGAAESSIVPWIDENFDQDNFLWLARHIFNAPSVERGKDYNHSSFCDLVISGLMGVTPNGIGSVIVDPLAPAAWKYFALENVRYHGHDLSIRFQRGGEGYRVLLDGNCVFSSAEPARAVVNFAEGNPYRKVELLTGQVSASLNGGLLTIGVAAGAVDRTAGVSIVWDTADRGSSIADWSHTNSLGFTVGPAGATNSVRAADLGIPSGAKCRVILASGYTKTSYVSATGGQWIDLGIAENAVYGFDLGLSVNAAAGSVWCSLFGGKLDNFTIGQVASTSRQIYLRHREAEKHNGKTSSCNSLYADQMTDMTVCNRLLLKDGAFTVNGSNLASVDTTYTIGKTGDNLHLFNTAVHDTSRASNARCYYLKLYDAQGGLIRDFIAALDGAGSPCLYDLVTETYCYAAGGEGALVYDAATNELVASGEISASGGFDFYSSSADVPRTRKGMVVIFR